MIRRTSRPDWQRLRDSQRPWLRRLLRHGFVLAILCLLTSLALSQLVFEAVASGDTETRSLVDRVLGGGSSGGASEEGGGGSSDGARNGDGTGGSAGGVVEYTLDSRRGESRGSGGTATEGGSRRDGVRGTTIKIRFDPTQRLRMFLRQIDELDHEQTVASLNKFIAEFGEQMEREGRLAPIHEFTEMIEKGATMLEAVMSTMRAYGPAGKETLDLVFDVKRADYEESLNKYLYLKQQGVAKDYKIYRYQQKVWMVDEMRSEFNKSFTFE